MENLSEEQLLQTFPKTSGEFYRAEILSNALVRNNLVKWMDEMKYICESDSDREKFFFFAETLKNSFLNICHLYRIESGMNWKEAKIDTDDIQPESDYYNILFKAHKFWITVTTEFQNIFNNITYNNNDMMSTSSEDQHQQQRSKIILEIPTNPLSEKSRQIIQAILTNEELIRVMIPLQEISETIVGCIQTRQVST